MVNWRRFSPGNVVLGRGRGAKNIMLGFPLMLLYMVPGIAVTILFHFSAGWSYGRQLTVLGNGFRLLEAVVGGILILYFLFFFMFWLVELTLAVLKTEDGP